MKIGSKVKILKPELFIRCGYPMSMENAKKKLDEHFIQTVGHNTNMALLEMFPFLKHQTPFNIYEYESKEMDVIIDTLAYAYNRNVLSFGGSSRILETEICEELEGKYAMIIERKVKHTGDREVNDYDDGGNQLINRKAHVLFRLDIVKPDPVGSFVGKFVSSVDLSYNSEVWIEKCHLGLVH